jgi:uncharacterized membrane protein (UPF0127 family)
MKKDRNIFFHGYAYPPTPQARRFGAILISSPCAPGGNEGLIKKTFLPFFICFCFQFLFVSISFADTVSPQVCRLDNCVTVEVVSKQVDMDRGLMYRTRLDQNKGMLFVFPNDSKDVFWMKNMHFDLDILWISLDGRIVYIGPNIPACRADPCPVYTTDKEARYVLELNSGYAMSHHWKVGDKLDLKGI